MLSPLSDCRLRVRVRNSAAPIAPNVSRPLTSWCPSAATPLHRSRTPRRDLWRGEHNPATDSGRAGRPGATIAPTDSRAARLIRRSAHSGRTERSGSTRTPLACMRSDGDTRRHGNPVAGTPGGESDDPNCHRRRGFPGWHGVPRHLDRAAVVERADDNVCAVVVTTPPSLTQ
jgi:hypothetical protein